MRVKNQKQKQRNVHSSFLPRLKIFRILTLGENRKYRISTTSSLSESATSAVMKFSSSAEIGQLSKCSFRRSGLSIRVNTASSCLRISSVKSAPDFAVSCVLTWTVVLRCFVEGAFSLFEVRECQCHAAAPAVPREAVCPVHAAGCN